MMCRSVSEHVFADSRIIIREDEPTSIIAFTLASRPYQDKLRNLTHQLRTVKRQDGANDEGSSGESREKVDPQNEDATEPDEAGRRERGTHLNYGQSDPTRPRC
jgi:1-phosphatidylinositol-3-phosphate 5-kinase